MEYHSLIRTSESTVEILAKQVFSENTYTNSSFSQDRWHELGIYELKDGSIVLHIAYRTEWEGESDFFETSHVPGYIGICDELSQYDPIYDLEPGVSEKHKESLKKRWDSLVEKVLFVLCGEESGKTLLSNS